MKRMNANDSSDEENDAVEKSSKGLRSASGDDLGDSFSLNEEYEPKKGWVDEILERRDADDSENESNGSDEDEDIDEDEDEEESEDDSGEDNDGHDRNVSEGLGTER